MKYHISVIIKEDDKPVLNMSDESDNFQKSINKIKRWLKIYEDVVQGLLDEKEKLV